jgi:hypothetical protein
MTGFVGGINRLFSFRMGDVVVKYMGEALARDETERAAAIVKAAMLVEALTSVAAFAFLALISPLAAQFIAKDPQTAPLFLLYGISILAALTHRDFDRGFAGDQPFPQPGIDQPGAEYPGRWNDCCGLCLSGRAGDGAVGLPARENYSRSWADLSFVLLAAACARSEIGGGHRLSCSPAAGTGRFAINTNFSGTINLLARDSEVTWVGYFFNPVVAGYFKTAQAIVTLVVMPINPFISTTYPEITRAFASRQLGPGCSRCFSASA